MLIPSCPSDTIPAEKLLPPIRKAIIPAAGRGTRLLPATAIIPKELLPVDLKPMIQHCIEEAARSRIEEIALILSPEKETVRAFLQAGSRSNRPELSSLRDALDRCRITYLEQTDPTGVADALLLARPFTGGEPFAVLLPDNITYAEPAPLVQMYAHLEPGLCALALTEYQETNAAWYGNCGRVECEPLAERRYRITRLHDKGKGAFRVRSGRTELVGYARYILQPYFFDYYPSRDTLGEGEEMDDTPILQRIIAAGRMTGVRIEGNLFDAGNPAGFAAANRFAAGQDGQVRSGPLAIDPGSG